MALTAESRQRYVDLAMESQSTRVLGRDDQSVQSRAGGHISRHAGYAVAEQYARGRARIELAAASTA